MKQVESVDIAFQRHEKIIQLKIEAGMKFLELAEELYLFDLNEDYKKLGHDTFEQYLNDPDVDIGKRDGYRLRQIYEEYCAKLLLPTSAINRVHLSKLDTLLPHINEENKDELLAQAETLTVRDLRKWTKERFRPDKAELNEISVDASYEGEQWLILNGDMQEIASQFPDNSFDAIVTDPPYPSEYLYLYEALADEAARLLVEGGTMLVMTGQTHLPEVFRLMNVEGIRYRWTISYLLPGSETRIWGRQIWNHWKPVLIYTKGDIKGEWTTDIVTSPGPEKERHYWGQSLLGMQGLIDAFVLPNSKILDPFCGAGTTIEAALDLGHYCVGIDNDEKSIAECIDRLGSNDTKTERRL